MVTLTISNIELTKFSVVINGNFHISRWSGETVILIENKVKGKLTLMKLGFKKSCGKSINMRLILNLYQFASSRRVKTLDNEMPHWALSYPLPFRDIFPSKKRNQFLHFSTSWNSPLKYSAEAMALLIPSTDGFFTFSRGAKTPWNFYCKLWTEAYMCSSGIVTMTSKIIWTAKLK